MTLTTHLHLVPGLGMCGAIPPLPQYVLIAWCLIKRWVRLHVCNEMEKKKSDSYVVWLASQQYIHTCNIM
jgi:hypothetical protein